eukprot:m.1737 g.1737  ORF g.1737 m.1737 type:complete len:83 (-) comp591_c0_seq1:894-1142(-)
METTRPIKWSNVPTDQGARSHTCKLRRTTHYCRTLYKLVYDIADNVSNEYSEVHLSPDHTEHELSMLECGADYRFQVRKSMG